MYARSGNEEEIYYSIWQVRARKKPPRRRVQGASESGARRYILRANLITFLLITFAILIAARYDIALAISYELIIGSGERVSLGVEKQVIYERDRKGGLLCARRGEPFTFSEDARGPIKQCTERGNEK